MTLLSKSLITAALASTAMAAQAHTGHDTSSLMEGLAHPFGADHLLAMLAVGVWSVSALQPGKTWQGPASFMLALVISAAAGTLGWTLPYLEHAVSLSVVVFGAMLLLASRPVPPVIGLGLITLAASLHGLAHGSEAPDTGFAGYAAGFLLTTATLHMGGVSLGLAIRRQLAQRRRLALGGLGAAVSAAGLYLFVQL